MDKTQYVGKYLYIYADIFFTKGYCRTMMCDLKKGIWQFIPNTYYELILLFKKHTIDSIENEGIIDSSKLYEFIGFLLTNNCGQIVDDIQLFPEIELKWDSPHFIENSIIDVDENSNHNYIKIANELQQLFCKNIQFRFFCEKDLSEIAYIIHVFKGRDFESIDFIVKYFPPINKEEYLMLASENPSVSFIVHSAPNNVFFESKLKGIYPIVGYVQYTEQTITSANCCGIINKDSFVFPKFPKDFIEGIIRNKCLNRKISISSTGEIKNCPSMNINYGNIKTDSLIDVYQNKKFRSFWYITKDKISICKDCEYRNVCNDCRAFAKNKFSKPSKCSYDPYHTSWNK
ncbi:MAG TPA: grasp-with-spasm system SPASM domain peptide maturase [Porphyromonadaceae bacterium]|jgi:SPASM domain peptide maturase of grasp-with-spasm system|nr:grasp-with-spasm system SPASM domain peptide maturase [Porphyromonadaceae bacterium]HBX20648.1 grasp-with-spasm system SPASM domain peptide maturase [Porphyromonadaceae bacterium]